MHPFKARVQGSAGADSFTITIKDEISGVIVTRISLDKESFASILLLQEADASGEFGSVENIGKIRENKMEEVEVSCANSFNITKKEKLNAIKKFEIDGWKGSTSTIGNHHYRVRDNIYKVHFHRFVDAKEE